jgi:hypothetical protein
MHPATLLDVFVAAIAANGVTVAAAYFLWRIKRDENDTRSILGFLGLAAFTGLALLASTSG